MGKDKIEQKQTVISLYAPINLLLEIRGSFLEINVTYKQRKKNLTHKKKNSRISSTSKH